MGKHTNIVTYTLIDSETKLNMRDFFGDNLLLNSENEKNNGDINEGNNNVFFEEELV